MTQKIISAADNYSELEEWVKDKSCILLVCDDSIKYLPSISAKISDLEKNGVNIVRFSGFVPNPVYDSVVEGVKAFRGNGCDAIFAIGGGSSMDVAKCIKLYSNMEGDGENGSFLDQAIVPNDIPFLAMPTTAGTGSEATRYAVIYYKGAKQSITSESIIPSFILHDPSCLMTLPAYQKKATAMDALCHAIESFWSVNSNDESKVYSDAAIEGVITNLDGYLKGDIGCMAGMLNAAYDAGKAINITQTTAGHAMCYKITSLYGVAHGHAAVLCDRILFPWMVENIDSLECIDPRGTEYLKGVFSEIAAAMGEKSVEGACNKLKEIFDKLELAIPESNPEEIDILCSSVNPVRLKNHPVKLDTDTIKDLYRKILNV